VGRGHNGRSGHPINTPNATRTMVTMGCNEEQEQHEWAEQIQTERENKVEQECNGRENRDECRPRKRTSNRTAQA